MITMFMTISGMVWAKNLKHRENLFGLQRIRPRHISFSRQKEKQMRDYDFVASVEEGPTTRQKWQAFWTMYRLTQRETMGMSSTEWQVLLWHGPLYKWYCVAEYGNCNRPQETPWELYRMRMRIAKTSEKQQILKEIRNRTGQNQNPSVTNSQ